MKLPFYMRQTDDRLSSWWPTRIIDKYFKKIRLVHEKDGTSAGPTTPLVELPSPSPTSVRFLVRVTPLGPMPLKRLNKDVPKGQNHALAV